MSRPGPPRCLFFSATAAAGLALVPVSPAPLPVDDGAMVYCLARRPELVRAAIILGAGQAGASDIVLRDDGADLTIEQWYASHPNEFARSCTALRAAGAAPPAKAGLSPQLLTGIFGISGALLGALLGWWATERRERAVRRRQDAQELRAAVQAYESVVGLYVRGWEKRTKDAPGEVEVLQRSVELAAKVRRIRAEHPSWTEARKLLDRLQQSPFDRQLLDSEGWAALAAQGRRERIDEILQSLANLTRDAEHVAYWYERGRPENNAPSETP